MKQKSSKLPEIIMRGDGLTLVELLIGMTIFILVLLPLSSIYISGITLFQKTQVQTTMRTEADFALSAIINQIQDATYFELIETSGDIERKNHLLSILQSENAGGVIDPGETDTEDEKAKFGCGIASYKLNVSYDKENDRPKSLLERKIYELDASTSGGMASPFPYSSANYIVDGLFQLSGDNKLIVYLVIAPRTGTAGYSGTTRLAADNVPLKAFTNIEEIAKEVAWWENRKRTLGDDPPLEYIRVVQTEFGVNNLKKG